MDICEERLAFHTARYVRKEGGHGGPSSYETNRPTHTGYLQRSLASVQVTVLECRGVREDYSDRYEG